MRVPMAEQQSRLAGTPYDWSAMRGLVVLLVGVGAVGGEVAKHLAHLGVRQIIIIDHDTFEISNLSRSVIFMTAGARARGQPKALVAQRVLRRWRSYTRVVPIVQRVEHLGLGPFLRADVVFSCVDNEAARIVVATQAMRAGVPLVEGGMYANDLEGMEIFATDAPEGGCGSLCSSRKLREMARREILPGEFAERLGCTASLPPAVQAAGPTASLSMSASVVAAQMVSLGVRRALSSRPRPGTFLQLELCAVGDQRLSQTSITPCADCPLASARAIGVKARTARVRRLAVLRRTADRATLYDVLVRGAAALRVSASRVRVYVDEAFSASYDCLACRRAWSQPRLIRQLKDEVPCCAGRSLQITDRPYLSFHLAAGEAIVELVQNTAIQHMGYRELPGWVVEDERARAVRVVLAR